MPLSPETAHRAPRPRHTLPLLLVAAFSLLGGGGGLFAQEDAPNETPDGDVVLQQRLDAGPYAVGFRVDWLVDDARRGPGSAEDDGRLLRVYTWYPAVAGTGEAMRFGDYLAPPPPDRERWATLLTYLDRRDAGTFARQFSPPNESATARLREIPVPSRRDARTAEGRFPLVLHSLGRNDYQLESTVLWEHLASHGYVVSVVPQLGADDENPALAFQPDDLERQAADLAFALRELGALAWVDDASVAVLGHSSGGIAALLLAGRAPRVDAIVGLDASFGTTDGRDLLASMGDPHRDVDAALLDLHARANRSRDSSTVLAMDASDRHSIAFGGDRPPNMVTHFDFQNWPLYAHALGVEDDRAAGARPAAWAADAFLSAVRLTRSYLDHHLRGGNGAWRPELGGLPLDSADLRVRSLPAADG